VANITAGAASREPVRSRLVDHAGRENEHGVSGNRLGEHYHDLAGTCDCWQYAPSGSSCRTSVTGCVSARRTRCSLF